MKNEELLEQLAELEHQQWMEWAKTLIQKENLSKETFTRWQSFFVPYEKLSEDVKELDRNYAKKVIALVKKHSDYL
ncbi:hypothetical protein [Flagellimonas sp. 2504JD4-2]